MISIYCYITFKRTIMIIVVGGQKGGTGKTTTAVNIAVMRALAGRDVYLYDIDQKQNSATLWASIRDDKNLLPRITNGMRFFDKDGQKVINPGLVVRNDLKDLSKKSQDIIVDVGGGASEIFNGALSLADIFISPINPGDLDMWTFATLDRLVAESQKDSELVGYILVNKVTPQPHAAQEEIGECDEYLEGRNYLKRLTNWLHTRKPVRKTTGAGLALVEGLPGDDKAVVEMKAVYEEIFNGK